MYDSYEAALDRSCIDSLQESYSLLDVLDCQNIIACKIASLIVAIVAVVSKHYVSACSKDVSGDLVRYLACLRSEDLHDLLHLIVICSEIQHVSDSDVSTILAYCSCDGRYTIVLTIRCDTFYKRTICRNCRKSIELAELDGLAIAARNRPLLTELIMYKLRLCKSDKVLVIESFHFW